MEGCALIDLAFDGDGAAVFLNNVAGDGQAQTRPVLLGGEESGGIATKGHIPERDGIWMGLILFEFMAKSGKNIETLIKEVYDIVAKVKDGKGDFGFNAKTEEFVNMHKAGIIDPKKVERVALSEAISLAGMFLTTEAAVTDIPKKDDQNNDVGAMG